MGLPFADNTPPTQQRMCHTSQLIGFFPKALTSNLGYRRFLSLDYQKYKVTIEVVSASESGRKLCFSASQEMLFESPCDDKRHFARQFYRSDLRLRFLSRPRLRASLTLVCF